ncbi:zinc finger protein 675-like [Plodia interpunctella]|uniref:zinc finger protein 675-like n=1 Tax=Plodia interpunctella TaxID=58824 RepID=UPI002368DD85|nr:zinc finger protein 675-like [Plodia interpunctella]
MDYLGNINNFLNKKLCFLCFKKKEILESIMKPLYIYDDNDNITSCIHSMMMYLFPSREIIFGEVCRECSKLILSIYLTLRRYDTKKIMYIGIIDDMFNSLHKDIKITNQPLRLHIKVLKSSENEFNENNSSVGNICDQKLTFDKKQKSQKPCKQFNNKPIKNEATVCDVCGKVCKSPNALKSHLNCHQEKCCPYCLKVLKTHSHYNLHVKSHEGVKKVKRKGVNFYSCNNCDYRSVNKCSLQAHIYKYHLKQRPFVCTICSKGFYKKSNLTEHTLIHNKVKKLTCEQCGENFFYKKTLTDHLRLHTGEKPFKCEICKNCFVTSGRRLDHMKRKHGEKNVFCNICGKRYSLKKDLNTHIKRLHGQSTSFEVPFGQKNYVSLDNYEDVLPVLNND